MSFLRSIANSLLAIILFCLIILVLLVGYGAFMVRVSEQNGLDYGAQEGVWVWIDEHPIHTQTWGSDEAPWIVLVHGLDPAGSASWGTLGKDLSKQGYHVLAVDLEGMGHSYRNPDPAAYDLDSQANRLAQLLNEKRIKEATIVGHDWGCAVALQLAVDQPQFVGQLVLVSPVVESPFEEWQMRILDVPWLDQAYAWTAHTGGPVARILRQSSLTKLNALDSDYWAALRKVSRIEATTQSWIYLMSRVDTAQLPQVSQIESPTLILRGAKDPLISEGSIKTLLILIDQSEEEVLDESGHYPHLEQRIRVLSEIASQASANSD